MDILIRRRLTGRAERAWILARFGSRENVEKLAAEGDHDAGDALWRLRMFDDEPHRLDQETVIEDFIRLDNDEFAKLTGTRIRLFTTLRKMGAVNLKTLTKKVGRDPKNVSQDIRILESFGLVESIRHGKDKMLRAAGNEIVVTL